MKTQYEIFELVMTDLATNKQMRKDINDCLYNKDNKRKKLILKSVKSVLKEQGFVFYESLRFSHLKLIVASTGHGSNGYEFEDVILAEYIYNELIRNTIFKDSKDTDLGVAYLIAICLFRAHDIKIFKNASYDGRSGWTSNDLYLLAENGFLIDSPKRIPSDRHGWGAINLSGNGFCYNEGNVLRSINEMKKFYIREYLEDITTYIDEVISDYPTMNFEKFEEYLKERGA